MTKRKPCNNLVGYVTSRKHPLGGWLVILDRDNGASDWLDCDDRWVLMRILADEDGTPGESRGIVEVRTKASAYSILNAECRDGIRCADWACPELEDLYNG